jgi:hypothetical protein
VLAIPPMSRYSSKIDEDSVRYKHFGSKLLLGKDLFGSGREWNGLSSSIFFSEADYAPL